MVLPSVLRNFALDPLEAHRHSHNVRCSFDYRFLALAGHIQGQVGGIPAALQDFLLALRGLLRAPRLHRVAAAGRSLCARRPVLDGLLLSLLPGDPAVAWTLRKNKAPPGFHIRRGAGQAWPCKAGGRQSLGSALAPAMAGAPGYKEECNE